MTQTFFAPALDLMKQIIESYDLDAGSLMREWEIDPASITDSSTRIPLARIAGFFNKVAELIPDPGFGLKAGQFWHPSQMGALGYAWMTSDTLHAACKRLSRFACVINDATEITLKESRNGLSLILDYSKQEFMPDFQADASMSILLAMCRTNAGADFHPKSVTFVHPEPEDTGPFYALFQCPVTFGAKTNSFTFTAVDADQPRSCSNAQLALLNDQILIEYAAKLDGDNIVERTKAVIIKELASGNISDAIVAGSLNMTERTLQRRLRDQGVTFKTLLNQMRRDLADNYIRDNKLSLSEISFMLGFAEISSFSHAFKRWTGQSPSDYRESSLE